MLEFPSIIQLPLAELIDAIMDWVLTNSGPPFLTLLAALILFVLYLHRVGSYSGYPGLLVVLLVG